MQIFKIFNCLELDTYINLLSESIMLFILKAMGRDTSKHTRLHGYIYKLFAIEEILWQACNKMDNEMLQYKTKQMPHVSKHRL